MKGLGVTKASECHGRLVLEGGESLTLWEFFGELGCILVDV